MKLYKKFGLAGAMLVSSCQKPETTENDVHAARLQATYQTAVGCTAGASVLMATTPKGPKAEMILNLAEEIRRNAQEDAFNKRDNQQTIADVGRDIYYQSVGMQMGNNFEGLWDMVINNCRKIYASAETNNQFDGMAPR